eukprot:scaffold75883_cov31-Tisochrysis_lutea.AAC.3
MKAPPPDEIRRRRAQVLKRRWCCALLIDKAWQLERGGSVSDQVEQRVDVRLGSQIEARLQVIMTRNVSHCCRRLGVELVDGFGILKILTMA